MAELFRAQHVWEVAGFLLEEGDTASAPDRWSAILDARCRSAQSRAYYAVFLRLKERLSAISRDVLDDKDSVHKALGEGVRGHLGVAHELSDLLKKLWRHRARSDYELGAGYSADVAQDRLEDAEDAIALVDGLSPEDLRGIVSAIRSA